MSAPVMLVWTLNDWPKAQYLAHALTIPPQAWSVPSLFVAVGGPEISAFEAAERPDLGELGRGLNALAKLAAAAAHRDPWVKTNLGEGILAGAFHPVLDMPGLVEMCERDGYRVVHIDEAMAARGEGELPDDGLHDAYAPLRLQWLQEGLGDEAILAKTLALPVWGERHHGAAFFLLSRPEDWVLVARMAQTGGHTAAVAALTELVIGLAHPVLLKRLRAVAAEVPEAFDADQLARVERRIPVRR